MATASFTKTQRGSKKLVHAGYSYNVIRYGNNGRTYWRCDESRLNCNGSVATDKDNKVDVGKLHNHAPSTTRVRVKMVKTYIRQAALQSNVASRDIVNSVVEGVSDPVRQSLPVFKTLQRSVTRKRKSMDEAASRIATSTRAISTQTITSYCAVSSCKNVDTPENRSFGNQQLLFPVPKKPDIRRKWCESLGQELRDDDQICELHFEKSAIVSFHMRVASDDTIHLRINGEPTLAEDAIPVLKVQDNWNGTPINSSSLSMVPNSSQTKTDPTENLTDGGMSYLVVIEEDSSDEYFREHNYSMNETTSSEKSCIEQTVPPELKNNEKQVPETVNPNPQTVNPIPQPMNPKPQTVNLKKPLGPGLTIVKKPVGTHLQSKIVHRKLKATNSEPETTNPEVEAVDSDYCDIDKIKNYFRNNPLPKTWAWTDCSSSIGIILTQISNKTKKIRCHLECSKDLRVQAFTFDNLQIKDIDTTVRSIEELLQLLELATTLYLCEGVKGGKKRAENCTLVIPVREQFKKKKLFNRCTPCRDLLKLLKKRQAKQNEKTTISPIVIK